MSEGGSAAGVQNKGGTVADRHRSIGRERGAAIDKQAVLADGGGSAVGVGSAQDDVRGTGLGQGQRAAGVLDIAGGSAANDGA